MSLEQFFMAYLWWQLPLTAVCVWHNDDVADFLVKLIKANIGTMFLIFLFWSFTQIVIHWDSWA